MIARPDTIFLSIQKIDFSASKGEVGLGGSVVLSTPVLVLAALVGYAYVALNSPVHVLTGDRSTPDGSADAGKFIGASPLSDAGRADNSAFALRKAQNYIETLNCLAKGQSLAPRLQDDLGRGEAADFGTTLERKGVGTVRGLRRQYHPTYRG